eukprot:11187432-Lingulodinium_polyedra.AAC.1
MARWSGGKRAWRCARGGRSWPTAAPPVVDRSAVRLQCLFRLAGGWLVRSKNLCCARGGKGCAPLPPALATTI